MKRFKVRKVVTGFMVVILTSVVYFFLPESWFPVIIDRVEKIKLIVSLFLSSVLSTIIINVNPKNFFNLRESSEIIIIILIISIFLCAIF